MLSWGWMFYRKDDLTLDSALCFDADEMDGEENGFKYRRTFSCAVGLRRRDGAADDSWLVDHITIDHNRDDIDYTHAYFSSQKSQCALF